jgi:hypothetical protein
LAAYDATEAAKDHHSFSDSHQQTGFPFRHPHHPPIMRQSIAVVMNWFEEFREQVPAK